ncbi:hypothetical protein MW887_000907 [Aspergillus wentii]|nr:hypothetical protein MW887_000907 [Aspergillus wentii]
MHHFGTQTASVLFPLAPPLFSQTLVSTALNTRHLLHALLAAACSHHARLITDTSENTRRTILKFTNLAISGLRDALNDEKEMLKPETAMTAMALCTNDVCNGNPRTWRVHLQGVKKLLNAVFEKNQPTDDPFAQCLFKWFATLDVSAGLSGIHGGCVEDGRYWSLEMTSTGHVDDICGYSMELLPLLARIGILARQQACNTPSIPASEAEDIETRILAVSHKSAATHTLTSHSDLALQLPHTHQTFIHSALLHLHRRVQNLPKDHPKVRAQITGIINAFNNIPPFSTANILILWPIFSAGCETDDIIERDIIQERMKNMQATGMGNFTRAREALSVYWEANTAVRWDLFFAGSGLELVLF